MQNQVLTFLLKTNKYLEEQMEDAEESEVMVIRGLIKKNQRSMQKLMEDIEYELV